MKTTFTGTFEVYRKDRKPVNGGLRKALDYFNMFSILSLAKGHPGELNGYYFLPVESDCEEAMEVKVYAAGQELLDWVEGVGVEPSVVAELVFVLQ